MGIELNRLMNLLRCLTLFYLSEKNIKDFSENDKILLQDASLASSKMNNYHQMMIKQLITQIKDLDSKLDRNN